MTTNSPAQATQVPDTDIQARARAVLHEKWVATSTNVTGIPRVPQAKTAYPAVPSYPAVPPASVAAPVAPSPAMAAPSPAAPPAYDAAVIAPVVPKGSSTDEMLRENLRKTMAEQTPSMDAGKPAEAYSEKKMASRKVPGASVSPGMNMAPPPAPDSKEGKLAALLQQYKQDRITPEEYHLRRAEIMGMP